MNSYFLLHGFLGTNQIFSKITSQLKADPETDNVFAPNLFHANSIETLTPNHNFIDWAKNFNTYVKENSTGKNFLIGYSMGGRLGIHAFMDEPNLWETCYFASSNPGLIKNSEKMARMAWEDGWCYQIDNKPWDEFISLWNRQDVFKHCDSSKPVESDFDKGLLKLALKNWSLTKHQIDLELLNNKKLHWMVGEKDSKYQLIFKNLKNIYNCKQVSTINGCGHRFELGLEHLNYSNPIMPLI